MQTTCPVAITLSLISDKWKILILHELSTGTKRPCARKIAFFRRTWSYFTKFL